MNNLEGFTKLDKDDELRVELDKLIELYRESYQDNIDNGDDLSINEYKSAFFKSINDILKDDEKYILGIGRDEYGTMKDVHYITLYKGSKYLTKMVDELSVGEVVDTSPASRGSDDFEESFVRKNVVYELYIMDNNKSNNNGSGFDYFNTSEYNLTRYQIYSEGDTINNDNCLLYALKTLGFDIDTMLSGLGDSMELFGTNVTQGFLKNVAKILKVDIKIHKICSKRRSYVYSCGIKDSRIIEIALYLNHYFIFDKKTKVRDLVTNKKLDSLSLIMKLHEDNMFIPNKKVQFNAKVPENITFTIDDQELMEEKEEEVQEPEKEIKEVVCLFADTESYFDENDKHIPLLFACVDLDDFYITAKTLKEFLSQIHRKYKGKNIRMYYHNLKYDWFVFRDSDCYLLKGRVMKDNQLYSLTINFYGMTITMCDSYKLITEPLKSFQENFNLGAGKKEYIMYKLYNYRTYKTIHLKLSNVKSDLTSIYYNEECEEINEPESLKDYVYTDCVAFPRSVIDKVNKEDKFFLVKRYPITKKEEIIYRHMDHYEYYLEFDCKTLRDGLEVFRAEMLEIIDEDCYKTLTLSSLVHNRAIKNGCYEGIYQVFGGLQSFIQESCFGGRVATKQNKKQRREGVIQDYDGVSLYPSAIARLCKEMGFPKGKAKIITDWESVKNKSDHYVVEIKALNNTKEQQIAFPCIRSESGGRLYTNMIKEKTMIIDKITLEDWVEFCDLEYEFVRGVYWNEGFNKEMGKLVDSLFMKRVDCKNEMKKYQEKSPEWNKYNCKQTMLKLCLNSLYGKTLLKRSSSDQKIMTKDKVSKYIINNYYNIKELEFHGVNAIFKCKKLSYEHKNMAHIGGMILSMSKRIMNEVMSTADDINVEILYQDTDSMHIVSDLDNTPIKRLEQEYFKRYNKVLTGGRLGQFHCDFNGPKEASKSCTPYSELSIILGKKAYYDRVISFDDNGNRLVSDHIRLKGANKASIKQKEHLVLTSNEKKTRDMYTLKQYNNVCEKYEDLYKGNRLIFDLACTGAVSFDLNKNGVFNRDVFERIIYFK